MKCLSASVMLRVVMWVFLVTDFLRYERDEQWKDDEMLAAKIKKFLAVRKAVACRCP